LVLLMAAVSLLTIAIPEDLPASPVPPRQGPSWLEVGEAFPDFPLPRLDDGTPSSISAFRGKKTILHLFASW
jgi:hypothetical protein